VLALRSITVVVTKQAQADGVLRYLEKHAKHVDSLELEDGEKYGPNVVLNPLPTDLRLRSLQLAKWTLQQGVLQGELGPLGEVSALKQLCLRHCELQDGMADVLAATLWRLPAGLEHLCIGTLSIAGRAIDIDLTFPARVLQQLQGLTYLELADLKLPGTDPTLQSLSTLTRLRDLRVEDVGDSTTITASMLSNMHDLTRLELCRDAHMESSALAGKTRLQHLYLYLYHKDAGEVEQLLSHLQHLQQLTHLHMEHNMSVVKDEAPLPAAAYSALTASSKLQYLDARWFGLPVDAWPHVFPPGRQLPHLQELAIRVTQTSVAAGSLPTLGGTSLVSCCPGLESLYLKKCAAQCSSVGPPHCTEWLEVAESGQHRSYKGGYACTVSADRVGVFECRGALSSGEGRAAAAADTSEAADYTGLSHPKTSGTRVVGHQPV
jgi:hypothetical protein